jgi:hypothetical protein
LARILPHLPAAAAHGRRAEETWLAPQLFLPIIQRLQSDVNKFQLDFLQAGGNIRLVKNYKLEPRQL